MLTSRLAVGRAIFRGHSHGCWHVLGVLRATDSGHQLPATRLSTGRHATWPFASVRQVSVRAERGHDGGRGLSVTYWEVTPITLAIGHSCALGSSFRPHPHAGERPSGVRAREGRVPGPSWGPPVQGLGADRRAVTTMPRGRAGRRRVHSMPVPAPEDRRVLNTKRVPGTATFCGIPKASRGRDILTVSLERERTRIGREERD